MKRIISACILTAACAATAQAGVNLNVNLGVPAVVVPAPAPAPPAPVVINEPPEFVMSSDLGFYVAVGVPYDLFCVSGTYYVVRDGVWYRSAHYGGPWRTVPYRQLPPKFRRYQIEKIHAFRDSEYRRYSGDRGRYHDHFFRPAREMKEERKEARREEHAVRKEEHAVRKEEKRIEHEERREHRHD